MLVAIVFGLLLGNFATSALYRIPNSVELFSLKGMRRHHPICSFCGHALRFYEFLPVLSWISTRGKCNYCGAAIPYQYTILEVFGGVWAFLVFERLGYTESAVLLTCCGVLACLHLMFIQLHKLYCNSVIVLMIFLGVLHQMLIYHSILCWLESLLMSVIFTMILSKQRKYIMRLLGMVKDWWSTYFARFFYCSTITYCRDNNRAEVDLNEMMFTFAAILVWRSNAFGIFGIISTFALCFFLYAVQLSFPYYNPGLFRTISIIYLLYNLLSGFIL